MRGYLFLLTGVVQNISAHYEMAPSPTTCRTMKLCIQLFTSTVTAPHANIFDASPHRRFVIVVPEVSSVSFVKEEIQDACLNMYGDSVLIESLTQGGFELGDGLILKDLISTKEDTVLDVVCCNKQPESITQRNASFIQTSFITPSSSQLELRREIKSLFAEKSFLGTEGRALGAGCCTKVVETNQDYATRSNPFKTNATQREPVAKKQPVSNRQEVMQKLETLIAPVVEQTNEVPPKEQKNDNTPKQSQPPVKKPEGKGASVPRKDNRKRENTERAQPATAPSEANAHVATVANDPVKSIPKVESKSTEQTPGPSSGSDSEDETKALERQFPTLQEVHAKMVTETVVPAGKGESSQGRPQGKKPKYGPHLFGQ